MLPSRRALSEAMPSTLKDTCRPVGVSKETVWPTFNLCDLAYSLARIVPLSSSAKSVAFEPCFHSTRYTRPKVAGSIAVIEALLLLPCRRPIVNPIGVTIATPGTRRKRGRDQGRDPRFVARLGVLDDQVARERAADRPVDRGLGAVGEHRHQGDERQTHRERGGRGERAAGLADRVLAGQAGGDATPGDQRADRSRQGRDYAVVAYRALAPAPQAHPQPHGSQTPGDQEHEPESATPGHGRQDEDHDDPDQEASDQLALGGQRSWRDADALAHRRERRHARGADRGREAGEHGHADPHRQGDDDRARLEHRAAVGQVGAEGLEQLVERGREQEPPEQPEHRPHGPQEEAFVDDRAHDLGARAAERAQQAELARALGDGDREGVEDDEGAHHQGHVGEHEQERAQEAEVAFQFGGVVAGLFGAGAHVHRAWQRQRAAGRAGRRA